MFVPHLVLFCGATHAPLTRPLQLRSPLSSICPLLQVFTTDGALDYSVERGLRSFNFSLNQATCFYVRSTSYTYSWYLVQDGSASSTALLHFSLLSYYHTITRHNNLAAQTSFERSLSHYNFYFLGFRASYF